MAYISRFLTHLAHIASWWGTGPYRALDNTVCMHALVYSSKLGHLPMDHGWKPETDTCLYIYANADTIFSANMLVLMPSILFDRY